MAEIQAECGLQAFSEVETCFSRDPSPFGKGCRETAGEGKKIDPNPALRATFSPREKDSPDGWPPYLGQLCLRRKGAASVVQFEISDLRWAFVRFQIFHFPVIVLRTRVCGSEGIRTDDGQIDHVCIGVFLGIAQD